MDVSFTNVLEGARQYFQGLPTATNSNAIYTNTVTQQSYATNPGQGQIQSRPPSSNAYWPPHHESPVRPPTRDRPPSERPPDPPRSTPNTYNVPSVYQEQQQQQQQQVQQQVQQQPQQQQQQSQHQQQQQQQAQQVNNYEFQFQKPASRDTPSHTTQPIQQYQSHILPNPSYNPPPSPQQMPSRVPSRDPATPTSMSAQTCQSYSNYQQPHQQQLQHQPQQQHHQQQHQQPQQQQQPKYPVQQSVQHHQQPMQYQAQTHHAYHQQVQPQQHHIQQQQQQQPSHHHQQQVQPQQQQPQQPQQQQQHQSAQAQHPQQHQQQPQQHPQQQQHHQSQRQPSQRPYYSVNSQTPRPQQHYTYQTAQSSYPTSTQSSFQTTSTQAYHQDPYAHHSYAPHAQQNSLPPNSSYPTSNKPNTIPSQDQQVIKENHLNNGTVAQPASQSYKTTHNLPPIAALSVNNYHSSRSSREALRMAVSSKPKPPVAMQQPAMTQRFPSTYTATSMSSEMASRTTPQYSAAVCVHQSGRASSTMTHPYYTSATTVQSSYTLSTQSSTTTRIQPDATKTSYQTLVANKQPQMTPNQSSATAATSLATVLKQKRESPLDLSVKTVRTSADSTLDGDAHANEMQRLKYYHNMRTAPSPQQAAPVSYAAYDQYNSTFQKAAPAGSGGAPKVDFLPNFNVPALNHTTTPTKSERAHYENVNPMPKTPYGGYQAGPVIAHTNNVTRKPQQELPRIDFPPPMPKTPTSNFIKVPDVPRKRMAEPLPPVVPSKVPKDDMWRQAIDQQIEQKFSSYKPRATDQRLPPPKQLSNGNYTDRAKDMYPNTYQRPHYAQSSQGYYNHVPTSHNQTYVPNAAPHPYPGYANHNQQQQQQVYAATAQHLSRTNSNARNSVGGAADKRVLNLLRNSLENKSAKEAQKKMEMMEQYKMKETHMHADVQQPSTDVMAPLQPKPGVVGRQNISPFAATSMFERSGNTPPIYKLQFPKAVDSIKMDGEMGKELTYADKAHKSHDVNQTVFNNAASDLDGLAAFLAARIRTKAELKQVGPPQNAYNTADGAAVPTLTTDGAPCVNNGAVKDKGVILPRRRLFSRNEEELQGTRVARLPPRDKSGLRSSSETSVFDFPDTDSEGEMPVLERQTLEDMRRDRKVVGVKPSNDVATERSVSPLDSMFDAACDKFVEQLKAGVGKKRGRRKKVETAEVAPKLETELAPKLEVEVAPKLEVEVAPKLELEVAPKVELEVAAKVELEVAAKVELEVAAKVEVTRLEETLLNQIVQSESKPVVIKQEEETENAKENSDTDSDVPLIKCKNKIAQQQTPATISMPSTSTGSKASKAERKIKQEPAAENSSDSDSEPIKVLCEKLKAKRGRPRRKPLPATTGPSKASTTAANKLNKPPFGDGSDFRPGWEEDVFKYKRSLRMPASLIHVTRPPQYQRLSTSLPDLDPCPNSPYSEPPKASIKPEMNDSDVDSNSNISFAFSKHYDSTEEGGASSVKSFGKVKSSQSILERLMEQCGTRKRKRAKKRCDTGPKIIPKAENVLELLPTPSLDNAIDQTKSSPKKYQSIVKGEAVYFEFRKQTINDFKDAFLNNSNKLLSLGEQFKTVVLTSRTRTETRNLKQKATIKEIFGEDRPASAPPVTCVDDGGEELADKKAKLDLGESVTSELMELKERYNLLQETKQALKNKLLSQGQGDTLLKTLANRKLNNVTLPDTDSDIKRDASSKSATPSIDGEDAAGGVPTKKRMKNMRRKFSSGFDYIRKKKKQAKKENVDAEQQPAKPKRKGLLVKAAEAAAAAGVESVPTIKKEVKTWVMNKGVGETHLHRAARLGYTDIIAFCLEKMNIQPSPKDNAGYTPLHEACARGNLDIARLLLMYGANVSESAQGGVRPLHEAVENGFVQVTRLLLSYGADPLLTTYSGSTPMSLATEEVTSRFLRDHIADVIGEPSSHWHFDGPASCFDPDGSGYNPLQETPPSELSSEEDELEFESSDVVLPNMYTIKGESPADRWILLQDLSNILKIKSRDALLRQVCGVTTASSASATYKSVFRELKMTDFLENCRCNQYMCGGEKVNTRASKIALVKYSEKVKRLLGVENEVVGRR